MESKKTLTLYDVFSISDQDEKLHILFHKGIIKDAVIEKGSKTAKILLALPSVCDRKDIQTAQDMIKTKFSLNRVIITPEYGKELLDDKYFKMLVARGVELFPAIQGYVSDANITFDGKTVFISLPLGGEEFLKAFVENMKRWIFEEFKLSVGVEFIVDSAECEKKLKEVEDIYAKLAEESAKAMLEKKQSALVQNKVEKKPEKSAFKYPKLHKVDNEIVFGKGSVGEVVKIKDITDDEFGNVTIEGDVFATDHKEIPSKNFCRLSYDITDYTGSVRVNKIMKLDEAGEIIGKVKPGSRVIVHGTMTYDRYAQDTVLKAQNMLLGKKKVTRVDDCEEKRVELHLHTNMSSMDGISSTESLIQRALDWGHKAIAITDHGVVQAFPNAMNAAKKKDIKIIYGVEAYFVNNKSSVRALTGKTQQTLDEDVVCFDIETTGLNNKTEEITEIAAVVLRNGELKEEFHTYVNPGKPIPEKITELTGISNETVRNAPAIDVAMRDFIAFLDGRVLAAHNAEFDIGFLKVACARLGIDYDFVYLDTLAMARSLLPNLDKHKLNIVAQALKLPSFTHHRAADDAATVGYMLVKFFEMLKEKTKTALLSEINSDLTSFSPENVSAKTKSHHMIILVKNYTGLKNLYKLVSFAHLKYFKKRPIIPRSLLDEYREGLIIGSACEAGELYRDMVAGRPDEELLKTADYYDYLEIQPVGNNEFMLANGMVSSIEDIRDYNRRIVKMGEKLNKPVVATGDVHFLDPHDEVYRRILMSGQGFTDADNQAPLYLKTTREMLDEFSYLGSEKAYEVVVKNTNAIADMCEDILPIPKETFPPTIEGSKDELVGMCHNRVHELYGEELPPIVKDRLDYELDKITTHGFDVMYMIAQKLVSKSNQDGYLVGSRGSVGSSFVAFLSGITEVNALPPHYRCPKCKNTIFMENKGFGAGVDMEDRICEKCSTKFVKDGFDIPFATFLGFDGDKAPDIDLNFSGEYQARAHKQTIEIFGEGHVFRAGTISAVMDRTAYGFAKKYLDERGLTVSKAEENRLAIGCTGIKRTTGQHPGGVMIVPREKEIYDFTPVQHPADDPNSDIITTHFDYHSIHDNLLKLDLLGHDDPTMIRMLEKLTGVDAKTIPLDDPDTMSIFTSTERIGIKDDPIIGVTGSVAIPEFGTKFVRDMLVDTQPGSFDELVRISGLSHGTNVWLDNAQTLVQNKVATLKEVICARDDIMLYLISKGVEPKTSFKIMESVRKGKGLTPEWEEDMLAHDVPEWYIESCKKIKYMFPKAHAVAYVMMAFRIAWFKVHYPKEFYSAYFTIRAKGFDASTMIHGDAVVVGKIEELSSREKLSNTEKESLVTLEVCHEFYKRGFKFEKIDLYKSAAVDFVITENGLIPPFASVPGLGEVAAQSIVDERAHGEFLSVEELQSRCNKVSKAVVDMLDANGALAGIPESSQIKFF